MLEQIKNQIEQIASKHDLQILSRGILPDHIHLALNCPIDKSSGEIALSYLNNLAYLYGMKSVYQYGFHVSTFGEYDLGVIPNGKVQEQSPLYRRKDGRGAGFLECPPF